MDWSVSFCTVLANFVHIVHLLYVVQMSILICHQYSVSLALRFILSMEQCPMCKKLRVEFLSDCCMISLNPCTGCHLSSLKYQYDCMLHGQPCIVLGQPSCTLSISSCTVSSFCVASHISYSISSLAGAICVMWCTSIFSMFVRLVAQSCNSGF